MKNNQLEKNATYLLNGQRCWTLSYPDMSNPENNPLPVIMENNPDEVVYALASELTLTK